MTLALILLSSILGGMSAEPTAATPRASDSTQAAPASPTSSRGTNPSTSDQGNQSQPSSQSSSKPAAAGNSRLPLKNLRLRSPAKRKSLRRTAIALLQPALRRRLRLTQQPPVHRRQEAMHRRPPQVLRRIVLPQRSSCAREERRSQPFNSLAARLEIRRRTSEIARIKCWDRRKQT